MKLTEKQREKINNAMDLIHEVKTELLEENKYKRLIIRLDKAEGHLYDAVWL